MTVCVMNAGKVHTVTSRREPVPVKTHVVKAVSSYQRLHFANYRSCELNGHEGIIPLSKTFFSSQRSTEVLIKQNCWRGLNQKSEHPISKH